MAAIDDHAVVAVSLHAAAAAKLAAVGTPGPPLPGRGARLPLRCSGDFVKYRPPFEGAFKGLIYGRFGTDRRYFD